MGAAGSTIRRPLADQVHDRLLNELMEGIRPANDALNIPDLANEFGVSHTPVREALARLEHTGLVRRQALRGYRVAPLFTDEELSMLLDARQLLEPELTYIATLHRSPAFVEALESTVVTLEEAAAASGAEAFRAYWRADAEFHAMIAEQGGNPFLVASYRALGPQIQRFRLIARRGPYVTATATTSAATEHRAILAAIAAGDAEAAAHRMSQHIAGARRRALGEDLRPVVPPYFRGRGGRG